MISCNTGGKLQNDIQFEGSIPFQKLSIFRNEKHPLLEILCNGHFSVNTLDSTFIVLKY